MSGAAWQLECRSFLNLEVERKSRFILKNMVGAGARAPLVGSGAVPISFSSRFGMNDLILHVNRKQKRKSEINARHFGTNFP